jgi:hypothetical protein
VDRVVLVTPMHGMASVPCCCNARIAPPSSPTGGAGEAVTCGCSAAPAEYQKETSNLVHSRSALSAQSESLNTESVQNVTVTELQSFKSNCVDNMKPVNYDVKGNSHVCSTKTTNADKAKDCCDIVSALLRWIRTSAPSFKFDHVPRHLNLITQKLDFHPPSSRNNLTIPHSCYIHS